MILDKKLILADAQVTTASGATTDLIDLGGIERVTGQPLHMVFNNGAATTMTGPTSVTFSVQDCATEGGTYVDCATSGAVAVASLVSGYQIALPIPAHAKRFVRGYFTHTGGSTGAANAFDVQIVAGIQRNTVMPDAVSQAAS